MIDDDRARWQDGAAPKPAPPTVTGRPAREAGASARAGRLPPLIAGARPSGPAGAVPSPIPEDESQGEDDGSAFPMDAFFIPEHTDRLPVGMELGGAGARAAPDRTAQAPAYAAADVAGRLEELAKRLRAQGGSAVAVWSRDRDPLRRALGEALADFLSARNG